jgi:hypothetical protein
MAEGKQIRDPIPENFTTLDEFDAFWSTHSLADYEDLLPEVKFNVLLGDELIAIPPALAQALRERANAQGVSVEHLVNTFLREKLRGAA